MICWTQNKGYALDVKNGIRKLFETVMKNIMTTHDDATFHKI